MNLNQLIVNLEIANANCAKLFRKASKSNKKVDFDNYISAYSAAKKAYRARWENEDKLKASSVIA